MKNVWTAYYNGIESTHFKNGQDACTNFISMGRNHFNGWTLRDDLNTIINDDDIAYIANSSKRQARRVSREEANNAWINRNSQHYVENFYDNEDCYD